MSFQHQSTNFVDVIQSSFPPALLNLTRPMFINGGLKRDNGCKGMCGRATCITGVLFVPMFKNCLLSSCTSELPQPVLKVSQPHAYHHGKLSFRGCKKCLYTFTTTTARFQKRAFLPYASSRNITRRAVKMIWCLNRRLWSSRRAKTSRDLRRIPFLP